MRWLREHVRWAIRAALMLSLALAVNACVDRADEHRLRAGALVRAGHAEAALAECDRGLQLAPSNVRLHIVRGQALVELDRASEARQSFVEALRLGAGLDPAELGEAHVGLAVLAVRRGALDEARRHFQALVDLNRADAQSRINLARVCLQAHDLDCALRQAEEAAHLRGSDEAVLFTLGRIYLVVGKYDEADRTFGHICQVMPGAASCPYGQALVAAQRGDKARALDRLREAVARKLPLPETLADDPLWGPLRHAPELLALRASAVGRLR